MVRTRAQSGRLICAGEVFFDIIFYDLPRLPRLGEEVVTDNFAVDVGGGAAITASVAAKLGRTSDLVSVLGTSTLDSFALDQLRRRRIGYKLVRSSKKHRHGGCTVAVSTSRDRYFLTASGANEEVAHHVLSRPVRQAMAKAQHVHFGLSPQDWICFPALLGDLRKRGVTTSWDLGWRPEAMRDANFRRTLAELNIVFMNEREALRFSAAGSVKEAVQRLRSDAQVFVVKLASRGAIAVEADGRQARVRGMKVRTVDSTGAGDAFNGGFLHWWLQGAGLEECLRAGNICGALSTRAAGGSAAAPTLKELQRLMRRSD